MARPVLVLRYFAARGRAQFIRYYFACRDIPYRNDEVSPDLAAWQTTRGDRSRTGPFQKLPVLEMNERAIAETLVIQQVLHRVRGDEAVLSDEQSLQHAMLVSSLYNDVMMPLGILLWSDIMYPGIDRSAVAKRSLGRLRDYWRVLEQTLTEWRWLKGQSERPVTLAECLLWEELSVFEQVFGPHASSTNAKGYNVSTENFRAAACASKFWPSRVRSRPDPASSKRSANFARCWLQAEKNDDKLQKRIDPPCATRFSLH
jgi:glutathione S-transferase